MFTFGHCSYLRKKQFSDVVSHRIILKQSLYDDIFNAACWVSAVIEQPKKNNIFVINYK